MSTSVLATKLYAPARRPHLVARPRLTEQLDAALGPGQRLTLVSAPAGFGKTTVLTEWLAGLASRRPPVRAAWLSLDEGDSDPARFLPHLLAALRGLGVDVDPTRGQAAATDPGPTLAATVNAAARAAADAAWEAVLVLDDLHTVSAAAVHEAVGFLVEHLPEQLHLVIATRADPPLPLARLRARGQLTEVRAADLRFTRPEAEAFLSQTMQVELSDDQVAALEERTEGWVAGLQLAALSLRGVSDHEAVADFVAAFAGSHRFVVDYLGDEVLSRQTAETRDFLLRTSVLDRLTGPLCDAVTGRSGADRRLEQLERDSLFLVPLDTGRRWFRYHHLFAEVLRARLLADHAGDVPVLHRRASDWHAAQGLTADAVRHAQAAGDDERAARLMEEAVPELRRTRQDGQLAAWVTSLPSDIARRSPVLSLVSAWAALAAGDLAAVPGRLEDAEAALAAGEKDPDLAATWADTEDLRTAPAMVEVYRASLAQARGDLAGTVGAAERARDLAGPDDHAVLGAALGFLGLAAWSAGDVRRAVDTFSAAVRSLHAAGNLVDELDTTVVLADMWVALGRPGRARSLYAAALRSAEDRTGPWLRARPDLHVGLAQLDRQAGDLAAARRHLETARVLREQATIAENRYRWFLVSALVRADEGDTAGALRELDRAEQLYRPGFYPDLQPIPAVRARLQIAGGDLDAAQEWADRSGLGLEDEAEYAREFGHLTLVRLVLAHQRAGRADDATGAAAYRLLDRVLAGATATGRLASALEVRVLQAVNRHTRGDLKGALEALVLGWAEAPEPDAHVRLLLDEGEPALALLREAAAAGELPEPARERARRFLHRADTAPVAARPLPEPLSPRELEVLRLLDSELTGPDIARRLYVSLNTVRTHTKHIFTKLDVQTRAAAVRRARERGLL